MSIPGDITIADKTHVQVIPPTGDVDGGTLLRFRDPNHRVAQEEVVPVDVDRIALPVGRTKFHLEMTAKFTTPEGGPIPVADRPDWVQVELVRFKLDGSTDTTGKARRSIVQPGTTTWADTFEVSEGVNDDDGHFGWTVTCGRRQEGGPPDPIKVTSLVWDCDNWKAENIYRLGGWNQMSDGTLSRRPWVVP